jgi:hypothetical protein
VFIVITETQDVATNVAPYFRQRNSLLAPLPTKEEIETSTEDMGPDHEFRRAVVLGRHFLVKYGLSVDQREGDTLLYIEQDLNIASASTLRDVPRREQWLGLPNHGASAGGTFGEDVAHTRRERHDSHNRKASEHFHSDEWSSFDRLPWRCLPTRFT